MRHGDLLALEYMRYAKKNHPPPLSLYILEMRSCLCCVVCHLFPKSSIAAEIEADAQEKERLVRSYSPRSASGVLIGCKPSPRQKKNVGLQSA